MKTSTIVFTQGMLMILHRWESGFLTIKCKVIVVWFLPATLLV
jgi:hypothetical protein